jgi:hypothetical protein
VPPSVPAASQPVTQSAPSSASAPQVAVSPARVRPGSARVTGPRRCSTSDVVVARVLGRRIARVTFYVDNKKVKTLNRANRGRNWVLSVRIPGLKHGTHRVLARVVFTRSSQTRPRTLPLSVAVCSSAPVRPQFTG